METPQSETNGAGETGLAQNSSFFIGLICPSPREAVLRALHPSVLETRLLKNCLLPVYSPKAVSGEGRLEQGGGRLGDVGLCGTPSPTLSHVVCRGSFWPPTCARVGSSSGGLSCLNLGWAGLRFSPAPNRGPAMPLPPFSRFGLWGEGLRWTARAAPGRGDPARGGGAAGGACAADGPRRVLPRRLF